MFPLQFIVDSSFIVSYKGRSLSAVWLLFVGEDGDQKEDG